MMMFLNDHFKSSSHNKVNFVLYSVWLLLA